MYSNRIFHFLEYNDSSSIYSSENVKMTTGLVSLARTLATGPAKQSTARRGIFKLLVISNQLAVSGARSLLFPPNVGDRTTEDKVPCYFCDEKIFYNPRILLLDQLN